MNRLTERDNLGNIKLVGISETFSTSIYKLDFKDRKTIEQAFERLAAYEDTGFPIIHTDTMKKAVQTYGEDPQTDMLIEEMAELTKALLKLRRAKKKQPIGFKQQEIVNVAEEMADVIIMLFQNIEILGFPEIVRDFVTFKTTRLANRLQATEAAESETT